LAGPDVTGAAAAGETGLAMGGADEETGGTVTAAEVVDEDVATAVLAGFVCGSY
jgi:hypothetical protein